MRGFPSALTKQAARAMWESLPTDIQTKIIDLVDIEREMVTGVVKPNALGPRPVSYTHLTLPTKA